MHNLKTAKKLNSSDTNLVPVAVADKISITPLGLDIHADLSFVEWQEVGKRIGGAVRSMSFVIGDWLVYGENQFGQQLELDGTPAKEKRQEISKERYDEALQATALEISTLQNYAYVARKVSRSLRNEQLTWEHHKVVAKLEADDQKRWLSVALEERKGGTPMSARRLRESMRLGRVVSVDEMLEKSDKDDAGIPNHIPWINQLNCWWGELRSQNWLKTRTLAQLEALLRDFEPIEKFLHDIRRAIAQRKAYGE